MKKFYQLLLVVSLCLLWTGSRAQVSIGGTPPSFKAKKTGVVQQSSLQSVELAAPDKTVLLKEDFEVQKEGAILPPRVAVILPVNYTPENSGQWTTLETGERIWNLTIKAPDAIALSLTYERFDLPEGAKLFIYSANKKHVIGAYTSANNPQHGTRFATEMVAGDELVLEYVAPPLSAQQLPASQSGETRNSGKSLAIAATGKLPVFSISGVAYMYNDAFISTHKEFYDNDGPVKMPGNEGESGPCMVNINCSEGDAWQDHKKGVAATLQKIGGSYYICSGTLVNNTSQDLTPYFLMAYHCNVNDRGMASDEDLLQWVFYFHYERTGCENSSALAEHKTMTGAQRLVTIPLDRGSDGLLLRLNNRVPDDFNVYYNGWDRRDVAPKGGVGIHHPSGDVKKISTYGDGVVSATANMQGGEMGITNGYWKFSFIATEHGYGVTEQGSSGSPLFNQDGRVIGTLTGGNSTCGNLQGNNLYGKMSYHWDYFPQKMKTFLDPTGSGVEYLDGTYVAGERTVAFVVDRTTLYASQSVSFLDHSNKATSWEWTFEGGSPSTFSGRTPPKIVYNTPGSYTVKLTINKGTADEMTKEAAGYITVEQKRDVCQIDTEIGTGTNVSQFPLGIANQQTISSSIYTAEELGGKGVITKLAWNASNATSLARALWIYVKEVDDDTHTACTMMEELEGAAQVYLSDPYYYNWSNDAGWVEFRLDKSYEYSGTKNLKIIVRQFSGANIPLQSSDCYYTFAEKKHKQWTLRNTNNPTNKGTVNDNRPNLKITMERPCGTPDKPEAKFTTSIEDIFLAENFETFPPDGWSVRNIGQSTSEWKASNHSEAYNFMLIDKNNRTSALVKADTSKLVDTWLLSPAVAIPNSPVQLSFYALYEGRKLANAQLNCYLSVDGENWGAPVWTTGNTNNDGLGLKWRKQTVDLSAYQGKSVYLAWQYTGIKGSTMLIDGVKIYSPNTSGKIEIFEGQTVQFTDLSSGPPVSWEWAFTGGDLSASSIQHPAVKYMNHGTYGATLTVTNNFGTHTKYISDAVTVKARIPKARMASISENSFRLHSNYGQFLPLAGGTARLVDLSAYYPKSWEWTMPGASPASSTEQHPIVKYAAGEGRYDVTLRATNTAGSMEVTVPDFVQVGGTAEIWNMPPGDDGRMLYTGTHIEKYYYTGSNPYWNAVAEHFTGQAPGEITQLKIHTGRSGTSPRLNVAIWTDKGGKPGTLLGETMLLGESIADNDYSIAKFDRPIGVPGSFFVVLSGFTYSEYGGGNLVYISTSAIQPSTATVHVYYQNSWIPLNAALKGLNLSMNIVPEFTYTTAELTSAASFKKKNIDDSASDISFVSSGKAWTATAGTSWIVLGKSAGTVNSDGNTSISFTCKENPSQTIRYGTISVNASGVPFTINVIQGGSYPADIAATYDEEHKAIRLDWVHAPEPKRMPVTENGNRMNASLASPEKLSAIQLLETTTNSVQSISPLGVNTMAQTETAGTAVLRWDNGVNDNAVGTQSGGKLEVAILFEPADLAPYAGKVIKAAELFIKNAGSDMVLKIQQGTKVVHSQPLSGLTANSFNRIVLTREIPLDVTQKLYLSYSFTQAAGAYVPGCDAGPAKAGKGDLLSINGEPFVPLFGNTSLNINWNLAMIVGDPKATTFNLFRDGELLAGGLTETTFLDSTASIGSHCYSLSTTYDEDTLLESTQSPDTCVFAKSLVTVTTLHQTKIEGDPNPVFSATIVGTPLGNDTPDTFEAMLRNYACEATEASPAGTYSIRPVIDNTSPASYSFRLIEGMLTVEAYPTAITQQPEGGRACQGNSYTFDATATGLETTYQWQRQVGNSWQPITGATSPNYTINAVMPADATNYRLIANSRTSHAISHEATLTVGLPKEKILVYAWNDMPAINCNPTTNGGYTFESFQWYKNGTAITGGTKPYILTDGQSVYHCEMQTNDNRKLAVCDFNALPGQTDISVYPNPVAAGQSLSVKIANFRNGSVINIYSLGGELVKGNIPVYDAESSIDVVGLVSGLYVLQVVSPDGTKRMVKLVVK